MLARRFLDHRLTIKEAAIGRWEEARNRDGVRLVWCFRVADASRKFAHVHPHTS